MRNQPSENGNNSRDKNPTPATRLLSGVASSSLSRRSSSSSSSAASAPVLYHPSIFRYTCTGRLGLDSRNGGTHELSAGVCRGVQSQLEHIDQWRKCTREEAIRIFQTKSSDFGDAPEKETVVPPASNGTASNGMAVQPIFLANVLVYPPENEKKENDKDMNKKKKNSLPPMSQEEWNCYGNTEVDLLVLRPDTTEEGKDKEEIIAAVSPYTAPGVTVREIKGAVETERTKTVRLGILEIVYSTTIEEEEEDDEKDTDRNRHLSDQHKRRESGTGKKREKQMDPEKEDSATALSTPAKVLQSSKNVLKHMQINGQLLYQSLQDDFPARTYSAGTKIYHEFDKTWTRTFGMMKKFVSWFADDGNDK